MLSLARRCLLRLLPESDLGLGFSLRRFGCSGRKRIQLVLNLYPGFYRNDRQAGFSWHSTATLCSRKKPSPHCRNGGAIFVNPRGPSGLRTRELTAEVRRLRCGSRSPAEWGGHKAYTIWGELRERGTYDCYWEIISNLHSQGPGDLTRFHGVGKTWIEARPPGCGWACSLQVPNFPRPKQKAHP